MSYEDACRYVWEEDYIPFSAAMHFEAETDCEFDRNGWYLDPYMDVAARTFRDHELLLDFFGCLDADCDAYARNPANAEFNANAN